MIQWSNFKFITLYWSPYASQVLADVCTYTCPILRPLAPCFGCLPWDSNIRYLNSFSVDIVILSA